MEFEEKLFVENEIIELTKELYSCEGCEVGGPLHIVLDDDNVRNNDILWCLEYVGDHDYDDDFKILCYKIGALLFMLNEDERAEIVKKAWDYAIIASGLAVYPAKVLNDSTEVGFVKLIKDGEKI